MLFEIFHYMPNKIKKTIEWMILKFDRGEMYSNKIRKLYEREYGIKVGIGSYGCFDNERIAPNITIGNYCSFANGVAIVPRREHPINYISTHPFFFNSSLGWIKESPIPFNDLSIGNDVWIGKNAIIGSKCNKIGNGAVIGAGCFVNIDVPAYAIVVGVPAKVIKYRFDREIIELIEKSEWYDLSPSILRNYVGLADNPEMFAREIIQYRSEKND